MCPNSGGLVLGPSFVLQSLVGKLLSWRGQGVPRPLVTTLQTVVPAKALPQSVAVVSVLLPLCHQQQQQQHSGYTLEGWGGVQAGLGLRACMQALTIAVVVAQEGGGEQAH